MGKKLLLLFLFSFSCLYAKPNLYITHTSKDYVCFRHFREPYSIYGFDEKGNLELKTTEQIIPWKGGGKDGVGYMPIHTMDAEYAKYPDVDGFPALVCPGGRVKNCKQGDPLPCGFENI